MHFKYISLRKKLVLGVFAISTVITTMSVIINFIYDYQKEIGQLNHTISSIENSTIPPIASLVWDFNDSQIQTQLDTLSKLNEVLLAKVTYAGSSKFFISQDDVQSSNVIIKTYDLYHESSKKIGTLEIHYDKQAVLDKLYDKLALFILLQFTKSFIISVLLLLFFQRVITSRLETLGAYLADLNQSQFSNIKKLKFKKQNYFFNSRDEISELNRVIKKLTYRTFKYQQSLNLKLNEAEIAAEAARAKSIYASKMASLGEMASGIAHEVNNPLAVIDGRLSIMGKRIDEASFSSKETVVADITKLKMMTDRISKIVGGLRKFARDGSEDPMENVSIQSIIQDTNALFIQKLKNKDIAFSCSDLNFELMCRPVEISQVLLNLINNAIDAVENLPEKWVKVDLIDFGDSACIRVIDSGSGISEEIEAKIMQPFFTTKGIGKGTGLGLSISKGIIEKQGGVLQVNHSLKNTCFEISLPKLINRIHTA